MFLTAYTLFHVALSLFALAAGFAVLFGFLTGRRLDTWTFWFLTTTTATSVTAFGFPVDRFLPSHAVGILSLVVLAIAIAARYRFNLGGSWRWIYVVTAMTGFYLNVFVALVQAFLKIPSLKAIAPTQSEPPFAMTQLTVLLLFIVLTAFAVMRFRNDGNPDHELIAELNRG